MTDFTGIMKFSAEWCQPCKTLDPIVKALAEENSLQIKDVDIDEEHALAAEYGIRSVPTLIAFKDGEALEMLVGSVPRSTLDEFVKRTGLV